MDAYEATKVVFSRIQALDPDHAAKIMGFLLIQDHGEKEMIRLAFGPEALLQTVMAKARKELGLLPASGPGTPTSVTAAAAAAHSPFMLSRQNSGRCGTAPSPLSVSSPSSWAPPPVFSRNNGVSNGAAEEMVGLGEELISPSNGGGPPSPFFVAASGDPLFDELQLQDQLAFLNDGGVGGGHQMPMFDGSECRSPGAGDAGLFPYNLGWANGGPGHRRSASVSELCLGGADGLGWKPCLAAAAAALMLGGDEAHKFMGRSRLDRADFASMLNPGSRQIYLTFPADSTFREEDVSNYFSIYGPVHDVRIPYQQKRMFGFVTFVYPETVKLILAKGNPHFICDARVLVKPYKEKGKVPDKYRKQHQPGERVDFSSCTTTGLDARDPFDMHQLGARMLQHSNSANEMLLRRKLEEQQQAVELQQAIELHSRRLMGLQLLDLKSRASALTPIGNPFSPSQTVASATDSPADYVGELGKGSGLLLRAAVNGADKEESTGESSSPNTDSDQSVEHNLPDSPFASPTKAAAAFARDPFAPTEPEIAVTAASTGCSLSYVGINNGAGNHLLPSASDMASPKPYFFPMSRLASDHGAIGM
ncbi:hypothetical protein ABZP36_000639 [Zizania latifolia]